jgi:hypothetical protein
MLRQWLAGDKVDGWMVSAGKGARLDLFGLDLEITVEFGTKHLIMT